MWVYSDKISCEFYWNNWYSSSDTAVWSSLFQVNMQLYIEYARITNQIFHNFSSLVQIFQSWMYLNRLFPLSVPTSCSNTKSFCIVDKTVFYLGITSASFGICLLIVFLHSTSHMLIHWHICMVHFLLLLHRNYSLVTGSLRKLYF